MTDADGGQRELLEWVRRQTSDYYVDAEAWATSFRDGRTLCALLHAMDAGNSFDFQAALAWQPEQRLRYCFEAASAVGIPATMNVKDAASGAADSGAIASYVDNLWINLWIMCG